MCWSVSGCRLTFRGLPSFTIVTGSSGSRYSWSARSRSSTSTNGSSRVAIASVLGPRVQHVGAVHEMDLIRGGDREERVRRSVEIVEQPRVVLGELQRGPAGDVGIAGEGDRDPHELRRGQSRRIL